MKITREQYNTLRNSGHAEIVGQVDHEGMRYDIVTNYLDQRTDHCVHVDPIAWMHTSPEQYLETVNRLEREAGIV